MQRAIPTLHIILGHPPVRTQCSHLHPVAPWPASLCCCPTYTHPQQLGYHKRCPLAVRGLTAPPWIPHPFSGAWLVSHPSSLDLSLFCSEESLSSAHELRNGGEGRREQKKGRFLSSRKPALPHPLFMGSTACSVQMQSMLVLSHRPLQLGFCRVVSPNLPSAIAYFQGCPLFHSRPGRQPPPGSHRSSSVALPSLPFPPASFRSQSRLTCWQNPPLVSLETATLHGAGPDPQQQTAASPEDRQFV